MNAIPEHLGSVLLKLINQPINQSINQSKSFWSKQVWLLLDSKEQIYTLFELSDYYVTRLSSFWKSPFSHYLQYRLWTRKPIIIF